MMMLEIARRYWWAGVILGLLFALVVVSARRDAAQAETEALRTKLAVATESIRAGTEALERQTAAVKALDRAAQERKARGAAEVAKVRADAPRLDALRADLQASAKEPVPGCSISTALRVASGDL